MGNLEDLMSMRPASMRVGCNRQSTLSREIASKLSVVSLDERRERVKFRFVVWGAEDHVGVPWGDPQPALLCRGSIMTVPWLVLS